MGVQARPLYCFLASPQVQGGKGGLLNLSWLSSPSSPALPLHYTRPKLHHTPPLVCTGVHWCALVCTGGPCCPWHPLPTNQNSILPFTPWPTTILSQSEVTLPLGALLMEWDGIHAVETLTFTHIPLREGHSLWGGYVTSWHLQAVVAVGTSPLPPNPVSMVTSCSVHPHPTH